MANLSVGERQQRARSYLARMGPAIEGSGGDEHTFRACKVGVRFDLDIGDFLPVLHDWNRSCQPPWNERELERKCAATYRNTTVARGSALRELAHATAHTPARPEYPPAREVEWLWLGVAQAVKHDKAILCPSAAAWLRDTLRAPGAEIDVGALGPANGALVRGLEPDRVRLHGERWPAWAMCAGARWGESQYRALYPLYDHRGDLRSLRARWTDFDEFDPETGEVLRDGAPPPRGKAVPPEGYDVRGLVMANETAQWLLQTGTWPESIPRESRHVWIVEGESDLTVACANIYASGRPLRAVIGVFAGAWTLEHAMRIPKGSVVVLATDFDRMGGKYAEYVQKTLQGRCDLRRKQWSANG